ncbi:MAG: protein kinase domain-containing protein [Microcystaceae cyanobacterium]
MSVREVSPSGWLVTPAPLLSCCMVKSLFCSQTNQAITLTERLASSGEGDVWVTSNPQQLAKIYHAPTGQRQEKLKVMLKHPPHDPNRHRHCLSFAWPQSLLLDRHGNILGFLMPRIEGAKELIEIYNPSRRRKQKLQINWYFLHTAAHNIASVIQSLHEAGYILGDIKPQNILINNQAIPAIIDTDSFQVKNPRNGQVYRCLVGSDGFTPPELLGKDFALVDQTLNHDYFRLGVIIYYLLFGTHPFQGRWVGPGDCPELSELIRQGHWVFGTQSFIRPSRLTISLTTIHPELRACFLQCFDPTYQTGRSRPKAEDWQKALKKAIADLTPCRQVQHHYYHQGHGTCYWCERAKILKTDIFDLNAPPTKTTRPQPKLDPPRPQPSPIPTLGTLPVPSSYYYANFPARHPFFRQILNRHWFLIFGNLFLVGSLLIVFFMSQEFPTVSNSLSEEPIPTPLKTPVKKSANWYYEQGYKNYLTGDFRQALVDFGQAIKRDPNLARAYYYRSLTYQALGQSQAAQKDWTQGLMLDPQLVSYFAPPWEQEPQKSLPILKNQPEDSELFSPVSENSLPLVQSSPSRPLTPSPQKVDIEAIAKEIENYSLRRDVKQSEEKALNLNLALSFYQQGIFYKNLGMNAEALSNLEQAILLLDKQGYPHIVKKIAVIVQELQKDLSLTSIR